MAAGLGAIALWGALATLSVLAGPIPPFQMVAMTFAVGAAIGIARARARGLGWVDLVRWPGKVWLLGVGGLFGYHALYFAALQLAPPAEANLVNYLWPLLIVLLSAPLAGERLGWPHLVGALLGFAGVALLAFGRGVISPATTPGLCAGAGLRLHLGALFRAVAPLRRDPDRRHRRLLCRRRPSCRCVCHLLFEPTVWPATPMAWLSVLALGLGPTGGAFYFWDHAVKRGDIRALGALLCHADPVDRAARALRPRPADRHAPDRRPAGHRRRRARLPRDVER